MLLKSLDRIQFIKLFLIFSFLISWFSISTSFEDLLIFKINKEINFKDIINFFRHGLVYLSFLFLIILSLIFKKKIFSKKNFVFYFLILYFLFQIPGLYLTENSIINISYIVSSLTIIFTIIFINNFFSLDEKKIFLIISFVILNVVFFLTFIPQLISFFEGKSAFYGLFSAPGIDSSEIFLGKQNPRSSGLARTALLILMLIFVFENIFFKNKNKNKIFIFTLMKIFFVTSILLFQSRTILLLLFLFLSFICFYEYKTNLKKITKFSFIYLLLPLSISYISSNYFNYKNFQNLESLENNTGSSISKFLKYKKKFNEFNPSKRSYLKGDISSGRISDWKQILTFINNKEDSSKQILFGFGAQADRYLINQSASNGLIYSYASSGIIGLTFFIIFSLIIFFQSVKSIAFFFRKNKFFFIYSFIVFVLLLRSILETSYAVFGIDLIVLLFFLSYIDEFKINIKDIKINYQI